MKALQLKGKLQRVGATKQGCGGSVNFIYQDRWN